MQVCVVVGVSFYGRKNITAYPEVRAAFKRALFVSAGVAVNNVQVALPNEEALCEVSTVNTGGYRRLDGIGDGGYAFPADDALSELSESQRMQLSFGMTNYSDVQAAVQAMWTEEDVHTVGEKFRMKSLAQTPDTNVFFSIVSNVPGTQNHNCFCFIRHKRHRGFIEFSTSRTIFDIASKS